MSGFAHVDPANVTPDELHDGAALIVNPDLCRECHTEDGELDTEIMGEEGACVFGCGAKVRHDTRMCHTCRDHSANTWECPRCGTQYHDWSGQWEKSA